MDIDDFSGAVAAIDAAIANLDAALATHLNAEHFAGLNFTPERRKMAEDIRIRCENAIYRIEQDRDAGDLTAKEAAERMSPYETNLDHVLRWLDDYRAHGLFAADQPKPLKPEIKTMFDAILRRKDGGDQ